MSFRVTVEELLPHQVAGEPAQVIKRFEQVVDAIDLPKVFIAVNTPPPKKRTRKAKTGNG